MTASTPSSCTLDSADARGKIQTTVDNRTQMVDGGQQLVAQAQNTQVAQAANYFESAMSTSLQADQAMSAWINNAWQSYADGGCTGPDPTQSDSDWADFQTLSTKASATKTTVAAEVNALTISMNSSLKSNWTTGDF